MSQLIRRTGVAAVGLALSVGGALAAGERGGVYEVVYLGVAPGLTASVATDVSPSGDVLIGSFIGDSPDPNTIAELWVDLNGDGMVDLNERQNLGGLGGETTNPGGMNSTNMVVGWCDTAEPNQLAFRWSPGGGIVQLPGLPGGWASAVDVNDEGFAVGRSRNLPPGTSGSRWRAVMWTPGGAVSDISPFSASFNVSAIGINNEGHILGGAPDGSSGWLLRDGVTHSLGGASTRFPQDINENGDAAGYVFLGGWRACRWLWTGSSMQFVQLPMPGGFSNSFARGLNEEGVVVGSARTPDDDQRAVLWSADGTAVDLNTLIDPKSGWVLRDALEINDDGVIVGFGALNGQEFRAFMLVPSLDADTDGDGLLDSWETDGIPYDDGAGGTAYYMLPGADPMRKNLYVEVDTMAGVSFSETAADMVEFAFAAAPVPNPDGSTGITLHIEIDEANLPFAAIWQTNGCWPLDFDTYRAGHYGTTAERASPAPFSLLEAKAKAFRYSIGAERFGPQSIGGCGELPGDNFVFVAYEDDTSAAAVFMHELGHTLGLRHGGGDNVNGKPNYPSIMNYVMSYQYAWNFEYWTLDFSRAGAEEFPALDESALDENVGIGFSGGIYDHLYMPFGVNEFVGSGPVRRVKWVRLDGSATDFGSPSGNGYQDGFASPSVAQDLNYVANPPPELAIPTNPSPGQTLLPHNDWARVVEGLALTSTRDARGVEPEYPEDELTIEGIAWLDENIPVAPPACPGDVNLDGEIGFADLNVVLADFNVAGVQLPGDIDRDGFVGFADLNIVVSAFNTICPGAGGGGS